MLFLPGVNFSSDGIVNSADKTYTFNLTSYVNGIFSGEYENEELTLIVNGTAVTANRIIFNGVNAVGKDAPKLILTYSNY